MCKISLVWATTMVAAAVSSVAVGDELTLADALAARPVHPLELEARERIAAGDRALVEAGWNPEGTTVAVGLGARRDEVGGDAGDAEVAVEVPLLVAGRERRELEQALTRAKEVLPAAASVLAQLEVERVYLTAWRDLQEIDVREQEVGLLERWLETTKQRVEAGAEAPFRVVVAQSELDRAQLGLRQAQARARASTAALATAVGTNVGSRPLGEPVAPATESGGSEGEPLVVAAADVAAELAIAVSAIEARTSRWGLAAGLASEGEEDVARVGFSYRFPRRGQLSARNAEVRAFAQRERREAVLLREAYAARLAAAQRMVDPAPEGVTPAQIAAALESLAVLVEEGKAGLGEVLAERRSLVEADLTGLERRFALAMARAEIRALTRRENQ